MLGSPKSNDWHHPIWGGATGVPNAAQQLEIVKAAPIEGLCLYGVSRLMDRRQILCTGAYFRRLPVAGKTSSKQKLLTDQYATVLRRRFIKFVRISIPMILGN